METGMYGMGCSHYAYFIAISFRVGYWPDVARSQPEYNRPTWHYELGPTLVFGDKLVTNFPKNLKKM